jgi:hypothetical protein
VVLPEQQLPATVEYVSAVPQASGQYDVRLAVELGKHAEKLLPRMTCTVKVTASTQP